MFGYENFKAKMQRNSEEKVQNVLYASWYGNTIYVFLIMVIFINFIGILMGRMGVDRVLFVCVYFFIVFAAGVYVGTRKAGLALSESRVTYVRFRHFGFREKEVFEIPYEKIKSLTVVKFLNVRLVKMSFISNTGRFERVKFLFSSFLVGPGSGDFKRDGEKIYNRLRELQKVIDRGDF